MDILWVQPPGARLSTHCLLLPRVLHSLPITPKLTVCEPLFDLAARLVFPPPAGGSSQIMSSGAIGREHRVHGNSGRWVDSLAPGGWTLVMSTCVWVFIFIYKYTHFHYPIIQNCLKEGVKKENIAKTTMHCRKTRCDSFHLQKLWIHIIISKATFAIILSKAIHIQFYKIEMFVL